MKKKKFTVILGLVMVLGLVGCNKQPEAKNVKETKVSTSQSTNKRENPSSTAQSSSTASQIKINTSSSNVTPPQTNENKPNEATVPVVQPTEPVANKEQSASTTAETAARYIQENYNIEGMHFSVETSIFNQETNRQEFIVNILPNTKEDDENVKKALKESAFAGELALMDSTSREIIYTLPTIYADVHIHHINYVYYDGSDSVMIVQDRAQDTLK